MMGVPYIHVYVAAAVTGLITINPSSCTRLLRWKHAASHFAKDSRYGCNAVVLKMVFSFMVHSVAPGLLQELARLI
jgi:hypothetical protein